MEGRIATIAAPATNSGPGALALIRVSGREAFSVVSKCLLEKERFAGSCARYIGLYTVCGASGRELIDQVSAVKWVAPRSFTGEDLVEIICHGAPAMVVRIMGELCQAGARVAGRGEFSRRAFENGKLDLMKAEAIVGLVESVSEDGLRGARKAYQGGYVPVLERWREGLMDVLGEIETEIEFSEDRVGGGVWPARLREILEEVREELRKRASASAVEHGMRVVIAGPVNAGKSSLLNFIVGYGRSIVDDEPGTTRDLVSERVRMGGREVVLIDSAGMRSSGSKAEAEGIRRAVEEAGRADLVVWVTSATEAVCDGEAEWVGKNRGKCVGVVNKIDLADGMGKERWFREIGIRCERISLGSGENVPGAVSLISDAVRSFLERVEVPDVVQNRRHEEIAERIVGELDDAERAVDRAEIAAMHVRESLGHLDELTGAGVSEEVLNRVFERFCIGK